MEAKLFLMNSQKKISVYEEWSEPFNNMYINFTRDNLSVATPIDEIVMRIFNISKTAILENGGRIELDKGNVQSLKNSVIVANYKSYKTNCNHRISHT